MIKPEVVEEIERLLGEEKLSQRKVARLTGVSRGTIATIAAGKRPDYEQLRLERVDAIAKGYVPVKQLTDADKRLLWRYRKRLVCVCVC